MSSTNDELIKKQGGYEVMGKEYKIKLKDLCHLIDEEIISEDMIITEGKSWIEKGFKVRIDAPNGYDGQQRHIHVGQYAWNQDGSRSHKGSWPNAEPTKAAKSIAAKGLNIDIKALESHMDYEFNV